MRLFQLIVLCILAITLFFTNLSFSEPSEHLINGTDSGWCYPLDDTCDNQGNCIKPIENVSFGFMSYNDSVWPYHYAQDFTYNYSAGDPVYSMADGKIIRIRKSDGYGGGNPCNNDYNTIVVEYNYVEIDGTIKPVYVFYGHVTNIKGSENLSDKEETTDIPVTKYEKIAELNDPSCENQITHLHLTVLPDSLPTISDCTVNGIYDKYCPYFAGYNDTQEVMGRARPFDCWDNAKVNWIWGKDWVDENGYQNPSNKDEAFFDIYLPAQISSILSPPTLTLTISGTNVSLSWTSVTGATGYTLFYAPYPAASYIGQIDMGTQTSLSFDASGLAFFVAIQSYNSSGSSELSNIEYFDLSNSNNIINIPIASINIDGDVSDWTSVDVLVQDNSDSSLNVVGSDMEYLKLALNSDRSRLYILWKVTDSISTDVWYRVWFDNDMDGETDNEPNDRQVDFEYLNNAWEVVSEGNSGDNWFDVAEDGVVASNGAFIEGSVSIDMLGLENEFWFAGRTMLGQSPYEKYDSFNLFGTVQIME